jgi:hypothetical protein
MKIMASFPKAGTHEEDMSLDAFFEASHKEEERWTAEIKEWAISAAGEVERPTQHERTLSELSGFSDLLDSPVAELETKIRYLAETTDLVCGFVRDELANSYALTHDEETLAWAYFCLMKQYLWETKYKFESAADDKRRLIARKEHDLDHGQE